MPFIDSLFTKCPFLGEGDQNADQVEKLLSGEKNPKPTKKPQTKQTPPILYDLFC